MLKELNYDKLPTKNPIELAEWFHRGANKGNLVEYLQGFEHTYAVMQTKEGLERIAYEMMEDMKNDGVVYVETRFAPVYHRMKGLYHEDSVNAVLAGLERGKKDFGVGYRFDTLRNAKYERYNLILQNLLLISETMELLDLILQEKKEAILLKNISKLFSIYKEQILILQFMPEKHLEKIQSGRQYNGAALIELVMPQDCLKILCLMQMEML